MEGNVLMRCGHIANAVHDGKPCCAICVPKKEAFEIAEELPDIKNREAKCSDCDRVVKSEITLPFFEYLPDQKYDRYYCGCRGWE